MNWPSDELESLRARHLLRRLRSTEGTEPRTVLNGQTVLLLCSNNYLGLANHPALAEAARSALERYGTSASGSRLVSGSLALHGQLEKRVAEWMGTEAALVFNSGYQANVGAIPALAREGDLILSDELNHASLIDGCRLSRARTRVFRHADPQHLESLLAENSTASRTGKNVIVTESVFSVDGDLAPLTEIASLARRFDALLIVDEAHAVGVFGPAGAGRVEELQLEVAVDIRMGTFSKALGSFGAFVAGRRDLIEYLVNRARSFIYSTALPPATLGASLSAVQAIQREPERRKSLWENVRFLREGLKDQGWSLLSEASQILPVLIGEARETMEVTDELLARGVFAQGLREPTVPRGTSRLRLTPMATHNREDLTHALAAFDEVSTARRNRGWTPVSATTS